MLRCGIVEGRDGLSTVTLHVVRSESVSALQKHTNCAVYVDDPAHIADMLK